MTKQDFEEIQRIYSDLQDFIDSHLGLWEAAYERQEEGGGTTLDRGCPADVAKRLREFLTRPRFDG